MLGGKITGGGLLLVSLKSAGVDYFFINSGTEYASLLLDYKELDPALRPQMIVSLHEATAVAAAHGYALGKGRPCAVLVHAVPGLANSLANLENAYTSEIPLIIVSGVTPFTVKGFAGSRRIRVHWGQDVRDVQSIVSQLVKWDYVVKDVSEIPEVVTRAVEVALTHPQGPVYIGVPRERLMEKVHGNYSVPKPAPSTPPAPPTEVIKTVVAKLSESEFPVILTRFAGRWVENVELLTRLVEKVGARLRYAIGDYLNMPTTNPYSAPFNLSEADFILSIDSDVPWIPAEEDVREDAFKVSVGLDPLKTRVVLWGFSFDLAIQSHSTVFLKTVLHMIEKEGVNLSKDEVDERRAKAVEKWLEKRKKRDEEVRSDLKKDVLTKRLASYFLGQAVQRSTAFVNEYPLRVDYIDLVEPGTFFGEPPSGALGWGLGAAIGLKLAEPERSVVAVLGDGSYVFNNPLSAHILSKWYSTPVMVVLFNDGKWEEVKRSMVDTGLFKSLDEIGEYDGVDFPESIDFGEMAEAMGLRSYTVREVEELEKAFSEAYMVLRKGGSVLVDVKISGKASFL